MKRLFEMIEALIHGEYDLRGEKLLMVSANIEMAANDAYDELHAVGDKFADVLIEGLYDISEDYDDGTLEEGEEYTRRVKELYERAKMKM